MKGALPILSLEQALAREDRLFAHDEAAAWRAMSEAGRRVGAQVQVDFSEIGVFPTQGRLLVLAGKGHNAGDALLAAREILASHPESRCDVVFAFGCTSLKPLTERAWRLLSEEASGRVEVLQLDRLPSGRRYAVCLDGIFGVRFRGPIDARVAALIAWSAEQRVLLRAAVDIPSGLNEHGAFVADFTYATGIVKRPLLSCSGAGRIRFVDIGLFDGAEEEPMPVREWAMQPSLLDSLRGLRPSGSDKRSFGHVYVLGGSRCFPGAILLAVLGALRSGAGLVTAFVPESLVPSFAARAPEAMWIGWPETPDGGLALEGLYLIEQRLSRANALVIGPGLGREPETLAMVEALVRGAQVPMVLDADALQPSVVRAGRAPRILTPHAGEFLRVAGGMTPEEFSVETGATVVQKGAMTRISQGGISLLSLCGGPVLARGGSGDLLAGLTGGLLAQSPADPWMSAARAVVWQGLAADLMARRRGQVSSVTSDLLDFLPEALRMRVDD